LDGPAETIILITDGAPDGTPAGIIRRITKRNAGIKEIHTVALGKYYDDSMFIKFLQGLASKNGGVFVGIGQ